MPLDDQNELFYLVDKDDRVLGSVTRRETNLDETKIHRAVQVVISNRQGKILLQRRSLKKDKLRGFWTVTASGHVTYGQTYTEAAERELQEEVGLITDLSFVTKVLTTFTDEQEYNAIFTGTSDETNIKFDKDEVTQVKWVSKKQLKRFAQKNKLTPMASKTLTILGYL